MPSRCLKAITITNTLKCDVIDHRTPHATKVVRHLCGIPARSARAAVAPQIEFPEGTDGRTNYPPATNQRPQQPSNKSRTKPAWQLNHVNPAYSLKRHIMKIIIIMIIKNDDSNNNDITITIMTLSLIMEIIGTMDAQNWITVILNCIVG